MTAALTSWRDGPTKQAIVDAPITGTIIDTMPAAGRNGRGFIPAADRIATFDNDGTLWVEQPMPPQVDFVFRKWAAAACRIALRAPRLPATASSRIGHPDLTQNIGQNR